MEGTKQAVRYKRQIAKSKDLFRAETGRDVVIFLGNSKILAGIIPQVFDQENSGITYSYNFSLSALPLAPHYFLLKDYLKNNRAPKFIILQLRTEGFKDELFPIYAIQGAGLFEVIRYALIRRDYTILLDYFLPSRFYWPEIKRFIIGKMLKLRRQEIRQEHRQKYCNQYLGQQTFDHNWEYVYDSLCVHPEQYSKERRALIRKNRGYYYIIEQAAQGGSLPEGYDPKKALKTETGEEESGKEDLLAPFVDKFFKLTQEYGIKVILIEDYRLNNSNAETSGQDYNLENWRALREKYKNVYFAKDGFRPKTYGHSLFSDPVHLNHEGACRYTTDIQKEFQAIIGPS
jgi:hypothetical protein